MPLSGYYPYLVPEGIATLVVALVCFALLAFARRRLVWGLDEQELRGEASKLLADIDGYANDVRRSPEIESATRLIRSIVEGLQGHERSLLDRLLPMGGASLRDWQKLHEAKRLMTAALNPQELVVRLRTAVLELRRNGGTSWGDEPLALAGYIDESLKRIGPEAEKERRALLERALRILYSIECAADLETTNWHNKVFWISTSLLLFVVVISAAFGRAVFLLLGALGGFLSKLVRLRNRDEVPRDYDSNWATLFLVGPLGALVGWSGVMLAVALKGMHLLGSAFDAISWWQYRDFPSAAHAAAFLLGFSAPLFERLIQRGGAAATRGEGKNRGTGRESGEPAPG